MARTLPTAPEGAIADIYIRLSTLEQMKGLSPDTQREDALAILEKRGFRQGQIIVENESGLDDERPKWQAMLDRAENREIDVIIAWKKDRVSRHGDKRIHDFHIMDKAGVEFVSCMDKRHDGEYGLLLESIDGTKDEQTAVEINERMTAGRLTAARQGYWPNGAGANTYGYDYIRVPDHRMKKGYRGERRRNDEEADWVIQIYRWFDPEGDALPVHRIATKLNEEGVETKSQKRARVEGSRQKPAAGWSDATIRSILRNAAYLGGVEVMRYDSVAPTKKRGGGRKTKTRTLRTAPVIGQDGRKLTNIAMPEGACPVIIADRALWERVQARLDDRSVRFVPETKYDYWLKGRVTCERCGMAYGGHTSVRKTRASYRRYECMSCRRGKLWNCHNRTISADWLETAVWDTLVERLRQPELLLTQLEVARSEGEGAQAQRELAFQREQLADREGHIAGQRAKFVYVDPKDAGTLEMLANDIRQTEERIVGIKRQVARLEAKVARVCITEAHVDEIRWWVERAAARLEQFTWEQKQRTLAAFRIAVSVSDGGETITVTGIVPVLRTEITQSRLHSLDASHTLPSVGKDRPAFSFAFPVPDGTALRAATLRAA
jgi:DNA invertase Pin-like site-specific DNA recombinase